MEDFIRETIITDLNDNQKKNQLIQNILKTQKELNYALANFELADEKLVDFYTYEIKAIQSKLDYLTKIAKEQNLTNNTSSKL